MLPFQPVSGQDAAIARLFLVTFIIAAVVFVLVTALVVVATVRFRSKPGAPEPRKVFGNRRLEIGWTITPAVILLGLLGYTVYTMQVVDPSPGNPPPDVVVIGHQWWWEFQYPKAGFYTANELHLPVGQRLLVRIQSADVIHSFWVPQITRKLDANPSFPTSMYMEVDQAGSYQGSCSEYCGTEHAWMRLTVIAQPPDEFAAWEKAQAAAPPAPTGGDATNGARLFQEDTCASCHAIAGTPAQNRVGPDLTHLASRRIIAGGVLLNTPDDLQQWIANPSSVKPGVLMPSFNLSPSDIRDLIAYLVTLK